MTTTQTECRTSGRRPPPRREPAGSLAEVWQAIEALVGRLAAAETRAAGELRAAIAERDRHADALSEMVENQAVLIEALTRRAEAAEARLEAGEAARAEDRRVMDERLSSVARRAADTTAEVRRELAEASGAADMRSAQLSATVDELVARSLAAERRAETLDARCTGLETLGEEIVAVQRRDAEGTHEMIRQTVRTAEALRERMAVLEELSARAEAQERRLTVAEERLAEIPEDIVGSADVETLFASEARARCDALGTDVRSILESRGQLTERLTGALMRLDDVESQLGLSARRIDLADEHLTELDGRLDTFAGDVVAIRSDLVAADSEISRRVETAEAAANNVRHDFCAFQADTDGRMSGLEGQLTGVASDVLALSEATRRDLAEARAVISSLPRRVLVDSRGHLILIGGSGELEDAGRVSGADGADGASVLNARLEEGELRLEMTDGRVVSAGRLEGPAAPIATALATPAKPGNNGDLVDRARGLRMEGRSWASIAAELGASVRRIRRLMRDADAEAGRAEG